VQRLNTEERSMGSYEKINYRLRPAKCIERKMLAETFLRLSPFGKVSHYRYVGFGSTYFSDFVLFHRTLGMCNMVSIERDVENEKRFCFNRPFRCIDMKFETSNVALPRLTWEARTITWLDYDGKLDINVLEDVRTVAGSASAGSLLVISVNAHPLTRPDDVRPADRDSWMKKQLIKQVGDKNVPLGLAGSELKQWGKAQVYRKIVNDVVASTLADRNAGRPPGTKLRYRQLFNFHYSDGAKMLTVGGLLYDEGQMSMLAACGFDDLPFVRSDVKPYLITVPNLTLREIRQLDSQLPAGDEEVSLPAVPPADVDAYAEVYRYFPAFAEVDM